MLGYVMLFVKVAVTCGGDDPVPGIEADVALHLHCPLVLLARLLNSVCALGENEKVWYIPVEQSVLASTGSVVIIYKP